MWVLNILTSICPTDIDNRVFKNAPKLYHSVGNDKKMLLLTF